MDLADSPSAAPSSIAALLLELEERSRARPDRVLRLRGTLPGGLAGAEHGGEANGPEPADEPFELLIFRGFSSLTTHPTAFDPDNPALPEGSRIDTAELLQAPLTAAHDIPLAGPLRVDSLLSPEAWR